MNLSTKISVSMLCVFVSGCTDYKHIEHTKEIGQKLQNENPSSSPTPLTLSNHAFNHALSNAGFPTGVYPTVDDQNSPSGKRYAIFSGAAETQNGDYLSDSGVMELDLFNLTSTEYTTIYGQDYDRVINHTQTKNPKISANVSAAVSDLGGSVAIPVTVWIEDSKNARKRTIWRELERRIIDGNITDRQDFEDAKNDILEQESIRIAALNQNMVNDIESLIGIAAPEFELSKCKYNPCVTIMVTGNEIDFFVSKIGKKIDHVDLNYIGFPEVNASKSSTDLAGYSGDFNLDALQTPQFTAHGFDGGGRDGIALFQTGVVEAGRSDSAHWGFYDWISTNSSDSVNKIKRNYGCRWLQDTIRGGTITIPDCSDRLIRDYNDPEVFNMSYSRFAARHATAMAGIVAGNITQDQDPSFSMLSAQVPRSGYSSEVDLKLFFADLDLLAYMYGIDVNSATVPEQEVLSRDIGENVNQKLFDKVIDSDISLINLSQGNSFADPQCKGSDSYSRGVNGLFEKGVFVVKSAGNQGYTQGIVNNNVVDTCSVTSPGSAIGALTITSYDSDAPLTAGTEFAHGAMAQPSSRGGELDSNGLEIRTIVDLSAPFRQWAAYNIDRDYFSNPPAKEDVFSGTSVSAAMVTGFLSIFRDHYIEWNNSDIEEPGFMMVNSLLLGDRTRDTLPQGGFGNPNAPDRDFRSVAGFDREWGAGRLKGRMYTGPGMDGPAAFRDMRVCIEQGETVKIPITWAFGGILPPDVDTLKVVAYWFDPDHSTGINKDMYAARLVDENENILVSTGHGELKDVPLNEDNKLRIAIEDTTEFSNESIDLMIDGLRVSGSSLCGNKGNYVYVAFYFEDEDRDDSNGPSASESLVEEPPF